ncbi:MAG: hypothetical protein ACOX7U_01445 [Desulfitobacteriia bacterium]|jgi:hypothetical protein
MTKDHFAKTFGFADFEGMLRKSSVIYENKVSWYVTKIPSGEYLTWNSAEIADDRVEVFSTREEAEDYLFQTVR